MAASRGCSFRRDWCVKPIWGNRYLQRSAADVAAEMLSLKRDYAPDHVWFADDIFGFRVDWVRDFAAALVVGGGGVPFKIQLRADLVGHGMAAALRDAGCREVWLGAESGSQKILDGDAQGHSRRRHRQARRASSEGIRVGFVLTGYVGEELDHILATRDLLARTEPDDVGVSVAYPLPGTKFRPRETRARREAQLGREQRPRHDVLRNLSLGVLPQRRDPLHDQVAEGAEAVRHPWDEP